MRLKIIYLAKIKNVSFPDARIITQKDKNCKRIFLYFVFIFVISFAQSAIEK